MVAGTRPRAGLMAKTPISAMIVVCLLAVLGCSDGSSKAEPKAEQIPIPKLKPPSSVAPPIDAKAWTRMWRDIPGSRERRCVDIGDRGSVRSGQFVVGNFSAFKEGWDGTEQTSKLAYIPLYPEKDTGLEVTATRLEPSPSSVISLRFGAINAWALDGIPFYATGTVLPERGHWRLEAIAGRNRGCFELLL
jgi:hypothetical protein